MADRTPDCPTLDALDDFVAGGDRDSPIKAHAARCADCASELERIRQNLAFLKRLSGWPGGPKPGLPDSGAPGLPPLQVEGYDIVEEIYRGGQGIVYRAIQHAPRRTVALKVLLQGALATSRQRRRFEREVELVAKLQHPNIVTVHDTGVTADRRHFYTMEYIEGVPLDQWIDQVSKPDDRLLVPRILKLFRTIAGAVAHAHQRGVIHRDLKPGNILVEPDGVPRVLDFGLAKALDEGTLPSIDDVTLTGSFMGTLAYASPEHVSGDPDRVDVRSDVYSLGVMLYEALSGHLPYSVTGRIDEVVRIIAEVEPMPLETKRRRSGRPTIRVIDSDTATVVLKALEKDPQRRYTSAAAFGEDLDNLLGGHPIGARRSSRAYVVRKAIARHPGWATAGALSVLTLLVLAVASVMVASQRQVVIASQESRLRAADARHEASQYYVQAVDLIRRRSPGPALELLDRAIAIDPTYAAAYLERGLLVGGDLIIEAQTHRVSTKRGFRADFRDALRLAFRDFERAHECAGGDWLGNPQQSDHRLTPAEARRLEADGSGRLLAFPDVVQLPDHSLMRIGADDQRTPVGGPGMPRALFSAGNVIATYLARHAAGLRYESVLQEELTHYYDRASRLDPHDVYTRLSSVLAAAADPQRQEDAASLFETLSNDPQARLIVEFFCAQAEVYLGGPRRLIPELHPQRDPRRAERAAREVTVLAPYDVYGWYLLGLSLQAQERFDEAITVNERALWIMEAASRRLVGADRPDATDSRGISGLADRFHAPLLTNLATCFARTDRFERAWPRYAQAMERSGSSPLVRLERAGAYSQSGDPDSARNDLNRARNAILNSPTLRRMPKVVLPLAWQLLTFSDPGLRDAAGAEALITSLAEEGGYEQDSTVMTMLALAQVESGRPCSGIELAGRIPSATAYSRAVVALALVRTGRVADAEEARGQAEAMASRLPAPDPRLEEIFSVLREAMASHRGE